MKTEAKRLKLEVIKHDLSVCRADRVPECVTGEDFLFLGITDEEISVVCRTSAVPENVTEREDGWRAFRICGVLDFSLVGILAPIAAILAEKKIGIFAVSTFNTDYILVKKNDLDCALSSLGAAGYEIVK